MVKILQAYNFAKQHTYSLNGEILSATLIDSQRIAISSAEQFIEIYNISGKPRLSNDVMSTDSGETNTDERIPYKCSLATVGDVVNLIYCDAGKYLLTLEKENVSSPIQANSTSISCTSSGNTTTVYTEDDTKMFVRIYANFWKFPDAKLIDLPITIRIASMTTPKAPLVESIDVIELPLRSPPDLIQCCQTSGNIIVSSKDRIYLYEYTQCIHENTQPRFSYIDFLPFKFFVNLNFIPQQLCLAENVIACMNSRYCVAFKIVDVLSSCTGMATSYPLDNDYDGDVTGGDIDEAMSSTETSSASKASAGPSSHQSFESDSLETSSSARPTGKVGFPGRTPIDFNVARMVNSACGREFEVDFKSQWSVIGDCALVGSCATGNATVNDTQEIVITPTRASDIKIKLVNEAKAMNVQRLANHNNGMSAHHDDTTVQYDIRKLLQICMKTSDPNARVVDILRCMDLKAIYQRYSPTNGDAAENEYDMGNQQIPSAVTSTKHVNRRTLKSDKHQSCIGYALLVASSVDGYLYQFCAQGKWYNENEKPIATYSFTAPVLKVHINDYVIYAITTESVETHTSRIGHKLFNNRFEYPTIGGLFSEESSPDVNAAIAVIGLCSFMYLQFVCVNRNNLVLISNTALANNSQSDSSSGIKKRGCSGGQRNIAARLLAEAKAKHSLLRSSSNPTQPPTVNEWTLYNLEIPKVEYVIEDLEAIAESYRAASGSNFYDLMEEAHVMLRLSLSLLYEPLDPERGAQLRTKFVDNCRKLANFSVRSDKKEVYLQATGFYKMCNVNLGEIYASYINNSLDNALAPRYKADAGGDSDNMQMQLVGLIYTVKQFLLGLGTDRQRAAFLSQLVKPFFTPNRVIEKGFPQVPLSLELLNLYIKYSPDDIPQIMLGSPVVADSISSELVNYLKYLDKLNPEENLLLAVTACRMSNYILSQEIINKTNRRDLATALIKYKNVLFDDGTALYQKQHANSKASYATSGRVQKARHPRARKKSSNLAAAPTVPTPTTVVSFSDFTETILLAVEQIELIEAISDAFVHAVCIQHSISLDTILQLFLNYIASHIGHKGYQTSQKVFANILQVYYYDWFDVNPLSNLHDTHLNTSLHNDADEEYDEMSSKPPSVYSERDNESIANSYAESVSGASSSIEERCGASNRQNRIIYDQLQEQQSPFKCNSHISLNGEKEEQQPSSNDSAVNLKGMKILFRMYLGRLKAITDLLNDLQPADVEQQTANAQFHTLRLECIQCLQRHLQELRAQQARNGNGSTPHYYHSRLTCTVSRERNDNGQKVIFVPFIPDYKLPDEEYEHHIKAPFKRNDFIYPNKEEGIYKARFLGWQNELLTLTLKIQSLLASPKIEREIIEEFVAFIHKTPNLTGIDSFIVLALPKHLAINYMLSYAPDYIWHYGKSNGFTPKHWESLLRKIHTKQELLPNWRQHITEILNNLVAELSFEELLQCFPPEVIQVRTADAYVKEAYDQNLSCKEIKLEISALNHQEDSTDTREVCSIPRDHHAMDNVDEDNVFELILRKAVAKQRSIALRTMIESTGTQLFDATNNPLYNL